MKTHKFDAISFFSGIVITAIGLLFLIPTAPSDLFDAVGALGNWFWPVLLLTIGAAVLAPVFIRSKDQDEDQSALTD